MTTDLRSLIPTAAVDVVGVFDVDFNQVFPDARAMKATVKDDATFFQHPLESSVIRTDHIIFNPVQIGLTVIMSGDEYRNIYRQIKQIYRDQTQLIVQTRTDTYEQMYIQQMPHDESPDNFDSVVMEISLYETLIAVTEVSFLPAALKNTDTKDGGQKEPGTTTSQSVALQIFEALSESASTP